MQCPNCVCNFCYNSCDSTMLILRSWDNHWTNFAQYENFSTRFDQLRNNIILFWCLYVEWDDDIVDKTVLVSECQKTLFQKASKCTHWATVQRFIWYRAYVGTQPADSPYRVSNTMIEVVQRMVNSVQDPRKIFVPDSYFTSNPIAQVLRNEYNVHLVGTMNQNTGRIPLRFIGQG